MKKRAAMVMAMLGVMCMVPMRAEAFDVKEPDTVGTAEVKKLHLSGAETDCIQPEDEFVTLSDIMMLDEIKEQTEEQSPEILIRIVRTEVTEATVKDGKVIEDNPYEVVTPYYIVTQEDTIMSIAYKLQVTEEYLLEVNPDYKWAVDEPLAQYAYVELPDIYWQGLTDVYYIVGEGDYLDTISEFFNTETSEIQSLNPKIKNPDVIYAGDIIRVK